MNALLAVIIAVGMLGVVPLGLRLVDHDGPVPVVAQAWPLAAIAGSASLLLDRAAATTILLASLYAVVALALVGAAVHRWWRSRSLAPAEIAVSTALVSPAVAAVSLLAERAGAELFGFSEEVLALTAAHFHYAGFAAALVAGLLARTVPGPASVFTAMSVPAGILLVLTGYFAGDAVELAGTVILAVGLWLAGWLLAFRVRLLTSSATTKTLFVVSGAVPLGTMLLAVSWAAGHVWAGVSHLSVAAMTATHGLANAIGFAGCGIVAWRRLQREVSPPRSAATSM